MGAAPTALLARPPSAFSSKVNLPAASGLSPDSSVYDFCALNEIVLVSVLNLLVNTATLLSTGTAGSWWAPSSSPLRAIVTTGSDSVPLPVSSTCTVTVYPALE